MGALPDSFYNNIGQREERCGSGGLLLTVLLYGMSWAIEVGRWIFFLAIYRAQNEVYKWGRDGSVMDGCTLARVAFFVYPFVYWCFLAL